MSRARRTDANHAEIMLALTALGWYVHDTSRLGDGFPDLVAARGGVLRLVEVKDGTKSQSRQRLTPAEARIFVRFALKGCPCVVLTSVEDAERLR